MSIKIDDKEVMSEERKTVKPCFNKDLTNRGPCCNEKRMTPAVCCKNGKIPRGHIITKIGWPGQVMF